MRFQPIYHPQESPGGPLQCSISTYITVNAVISTHDVAVPPFLIYQGMSLLDSWVSTHKPTPVQNADVTNPGFSNTAMTIRG